MTTKKNILAIGFLLFLLVALNAKAQPENFMIGGYVFPRPSAWTWTDLPQRAMVSAKMVLRNEKSGTDADIVFVETKAGGGWASADDTIKRWEKNFMEKSEKQNPQREERRISKAKVTFFWQEGTYKMASGPEIVTARSDFAQYGVIIDNGTNNIIARVLGDKDLVSNAKAEFKRLVEQALADTE